MDDWIHVSVEAARPPQFRTTTMSSNQISDTATATAKLPLRPQAPTTTQTNVSSKSGPPPYEVASSNTNGTESTGSSRATTRPGNPSQSSPYCLIAPASQVTALTKDSLEQQQHKLARRAPGTLSVWIEAAAPGYAKHVTLKHTGYAQPPRTDPSVASDNSYELLPSPVTDNRLELETRATGTQFNDQYVPPCFDKADLDMSLNVSEV